MKGEILSIYKLHLRQQFLAKNDVSFISFANHALKIPKRNLKTFEDCLSSATRELSLLTPARTLHILALCHSYEVNLGAAQPSSKKLVVSPLFATNLLQTLSWGYGWEALNSLSISVFSLCIHFHFFFPICIDPFEVPTTRANPNGENPTDNCAVCLIEWVTLNVAKVSNTNQLIHSEFSTLHHFHPPLFLIITVQCIVCINSLPPITSQISIELPPAITIRPPKGKNSTFSETSNQRDECNTMYFLTHNVVQPSTQSSNKETNDKPSE